MEFEYQLGGDIESIIFIICYCLEEICIIDVRGGFIVVECVDVFFGGCDDFFVCYDYFYFQ